MLASNFIGKLDSPGSTSGMWELCGAEQSLALKARQQVGGERGK